MDGPTLVSLKLPINQSKTCADPEGGGGTGGPDPPPLKNHKNIGFLSNTGPDPLKNHKATKSDSSGIWIHSLTKKKLYPL